ncbi:MAG: hypothetical protein WD534_08720 [Phycisphaeraceae bacterium]
MGPNGQRLIFTLRRWRCDAANATDWNNISRNVLHYDVLTCRPDGSDLQPIFPDIPGSGHPSIHPSGHLLTDTYARETPLAYGDGSIPLRWINLQTGEERRPVRIMAAVDNFRSGPLRVAPTPPGIAHGNGSPSTASRTTPAISTSPTWRR